MEAKALEQMNVKALREEAEGLGMGLPTRTKKADLLAAIQKQMAEDAEAVQAEIDAANAKIEEIAEEHEKDAERLKIPEDGPEIAPDPEPETPPAPPAVKVKTPSKRELKAAAEAKIEPWSGPEWDCKTPAAFIKSGLLLEIGIVAIGKGVAARWPEYRGAGGPVASARVYLNRMIKSGDLLAGGKISKKGEGILAGWKSGAEKAKSPPTS